MSTKILLLILLSTIDVKTEDRCQGKKEKRYHMQKNHLLRFRYKFTCAKDDPGSRAGNSWKKAKAKYPERWIEVERRAKVADE
jgi:hypothetical protein